MHTYRSQWLAPSVEKDPHCGIIYTLYNSLNGYDIYVASYIYEGTELKLHGS